MSELEEKLSAILGNPQAMSQIMSLAQSLGGSAASSGAEKIAPENAEAAVPAPPSQQEPETPPADLTALLGALSGGEGGVDPRLLKLASRVMQESRTEDDEKTALLQALRPYVREKRYAKLDKAIQIARFARLIRVALDIFMGEEHV